MIDTETWPVVLFCLSFAAPGLLIFMAILFVRGRSLKGRRASRRR